MNRLEFRLMDAKEKREMWAQTAVDAKAVAIFVDGIEILDFISCQDSFYERMAHSESPTDRFGHLSPSVLYRELTRIDPMIPQAILCCGECGKISCCSVEVFIRFTNRSAFWVIEREFSSGSYQLKFQFPIDNYEAQLSYLQQMMAESDSQSNEKGDRI